MKTNTGPELAEKIKSLCKARGILIQHFEKDVGFSHGYVRKLTHQRSTPSVDRINVIANYFGVTVEWLLGLDADGKQKKKAAVIPLVGRVACGIPITAEENIIGEEEITPKMASRGELFALLIKGDSMAPFIMEGDKVIVIQQDTAENGDIVIALIGGADGVCKEYKKTSSGLMLISKNPTYEPMVFTHAEIDSEPVKILGKVIEIRRPL